MTQQIHPSPPEVAADPFAAELHGGILSPRPVMKVRFRLRGQHAGPVYEGQNLIMPCYGCGSERKLPAREFVLPTSEETGEISVEIHTLRFGHAPWLTACAPTLDAYAARHGYTIRSWHPDDFRVTYPTAKFGCREMLEAFLAGKAQWFFFVDADVFVHPLAPRIPLQPGLTMARDRPSQWSRGFEKWESEVFPQFTPSADWTYRNAGIWACDRATAAALLKLWQPPFHDVCQEQHQLNHWLRVLSESGLAPVHLLPECWNRFPNELHASHFFHLCGANKERKLADFRQALLLPFPAEPFVKLDSLPATARAVCCPWLSTADGDRDLRQNLPDWLNNFEDRQCPFYLLADVPPPWLGEFPRVEFQEAPTYEAALALGLQLAEEVLWINDDVACPVSCDWETFATALPVSTLSVDSIKSDAKSANTWRQGRGRLAAHLQHLGLPTADYSTHQPYRFRRPKALATLATFGIWRKIPFETAYFNSP